MVRLECMLKMCGSSKVVFSALSSGSKTEKKCLIIFTVFSNLFMIKLHLNQKSILSLLVWTQITFLNKNIVKCVIK